MVFHVLNRGVGRMPIFKSKKDFEAFARVLDETLRVAPMRICAYCWMPNHWHFVLWPRHDGELSTFMQRMTNMHTQRWQRAKLKVVTGCPIGGKKRPSCWASNRRFVLAADHVAKNYKNRNDALCP
jgi:putative transposase